MRAGEFGRLTPQRARLLARQLKQRELRTTRRFAVLATCFVGGSPDDIFPELRELRGEPDEDELGRKLAAAFGVSLESEE
jgi:hypothetical protein